MPRAPGRSNNSLTASRPISGSNRRVAPSSAIPSAAACAIGGGRRAELLEARLSLCAAGRRGAPVPGQRRRGIAPQTDRAELAEILGVIGLGEPDGGGAVATLGGTLEETARRDDIGGGEQLIAAPDHESGGRVRRHLARWR